MKMFKAILVLGLLMFSVWPSYGQVSMVGVVDGERLFDEYPGAQDASKRISDVQDELRNEITESEKVYTKFEEQKKSETEKLTKKKELQSKIDLKAQEARKLIENLSGKIEKDIVEAIQIVSKKKGIDVVFDKRAVLVGGNDITDSVAEYLKNKPQAVGTTTGTPAEEKKP